MLINLDSEDSDALTVGSAGGGDVELRLPVEWDGPGTGTAGAELRVSDLSGGHSGLQIDEPHANAIKLLVDALERLRSAELEYRLASVDGGSASNAIPRRAIAGLEIAAGDLPLAERLAGEALDAARASWGATEPGMTIELGAAPSHASVLTGGATARLLNLLHRLPHGVLTRSERFAATVETSANLAVIETDPAMVRILTSVRSFSDAGLGAVEATIGELAKGAAASCEVTGGYPAWEPLAESHLVEAAVEAYRGTYGREPRIDVLHAGLECGAFVAGKPGLEAVSFGPRINDAHTPREHVYASTVTSTWELLVALLGELSSRA
jgi:dipeptidase D